MDAKKLFHAIVVIGMTTGAACSSGTTDPQQDAAAADSGSGNDSSTKDVATADTGGGTDAGGDGFVAWLGC